MKKIEKKGNVVRNPNREGPVSRPLSFKMILGGNQGSGVPAGELRLVIAAGPIRR